MFTGVIRHQGTITATQERADGARELEITSDMASTLAEGDSVATNGVCLTVMKPSPTGFMFRLMHETLSRTTLGELREGDEVNLEQALQAGDSFDGHFVQGHVDDVTIVTHIAEVGDDRVFTIEPDASLMPQLVPKGSVALDGVSLTVVDVTSDAFTVSLMPYTLEHTTLGKASVGTNLNVETDMLAKHVVHFMQHYS